MNPIGGILIPVSLLFTVFIIGPMTKTQGMGARKIARFGMFAAMAIALGIVESLLPDFLLPGMKVGFPNLAIVLILYIDGFVPAIIISLVRVLLVTLLRGSFLSMGGWMSFAGALASILIMALAKRLFRGASPIGISLLGSGFHVAAQIGVALIYLQTSAILYYLPFMLLMSIGSGLAIGLLDDRILRIIARKKP